VYVVLTLYGPNKSKYLEFTNFELSEGSITVIPLFKL